MILKTFVTNFLTFIFHLILEIKLVENIITFTDSQKILIFIIEANQNLMFTKTL